MRSSRPQEPRPSNEESEPQPLLLTVNEVVRLLGLGRTTVFTMLAARELPAVRIGRAVRIPREALERWIRDRTEGDHGEHPRS